MNDRRAPSVSGPGVRELETLLTAAASVCVGPFAIGAAAALATVAFRWPRAWLAALTVPSLAGAFLLWPLERRQLLATATAIHHAHGTPEQLIFHVVAPLLPVWLCSLTLIPVLALVIVERRRSALDVHGEQVGRAASVARLERRCARRAGRDQARTGDGDGLFLGYRLGGDELLPSRRGRVALPLQRLAHHLVVAGATGSGKTETVLRLAYSAATTTPWAIVYIDGKGDLQTRERFAALMASTGRTVALFPEQRYDGWRGSPEEIANRLLQLIDFAQEGGGTYYRDLAVAAIRLACFTGQGPPRSSRELLRRLVPAGLKQLHAGTARAADADAFKEEDLNSIHARYAAFFATVGDALDGALSFEQVDSAYFLLDGLRLKHEAGYLARFLIEEFTQWAVARKPREQRVLLIVDEFSAIAQSSRALVDVVERARGFGVAAVLCPQVAEGMGGEEATARIIGSAQTILLHATAMPSQLADVGGTRRVYEFSHQLDNEAATGLGSARLQHEYRVDLDEVRRLKVGQCFAISPGQAMKLQIVAAPALTSLHQQPSLEPVGRRT